MLLLIVSFTASACGDRCDRLCSRTATAVEAACLNGAATEAELDELRGWARACRADWDAQTAVLSSREQELALQVCEDTSDAVKGWSCEELQPLVYSESE